ncbi:hypothetical protein EYF80_035775 [Liparis tanakae]|uniref:Uncharacterized protein n=1 Tax=Liparis tanakae TaxID=230148 RepID=A0A4Z2GKG4_9TELE|nr:hypothetical protein EYF80_035775 [Liparis tanakae]
MPLLNGSQDMITINCPPTLHIKLGAKILHPEFLMTSSLHLLGDRVRPPPAHTESGGPEGLQLWMNEKRKVSQAALPHKSPSPAPVSSPHFVSTLSYTSPQGRLSPPPLCSANHRHAPSTNMHMSTPCDSEVTEAWRNSSRMDDSPVSHIKSLPGIACPNLGKKTISSWFQVLPLRDESIIQQMEHISYTDGESLAWVGGERWRLGHGTYQTFALIFPISQLSHQCPTDSLEPDVVRALAMVVQPHLLCQGEKEGPQLDDL